VATINDEPITFDEFQRVYKNIVEQVRARFGGNINDELLQALNVKQQALDSLIEQKLIDQEARKLEITVSDKELSDSLLTIKAFQKNGVFDLAKYKQVLSFSSMNPEIFEVQQRNTLMQQKIKDFVLSAVNVSDMEVRNWYVFQNTKTAVDYFVFSPDDYKDIKTDEKQIQAYYDENKNSYKSDPQLKAAYLRYSPEDFKDTVKVTAANIQDYYEQNIKEFQIPEKIEARHVLITTEQGADEAAIETARKEAQKIYEKAKNGDDFAELAKKYSKGPSKDSGGYIGTFSRQDVVKSFGDKAFSMKPGDISEPVKTDFGWHVIKVVARFDASVATLEKASDKIKKDLEFQEMQNAAYYKAGEAFDAVLDGDDLEQAGLITGAKILATKAFDGNGNGLEIENSALFAKEAFDLENDEISDVKQLGDDYYLIKIVERINPEIQALDVVKAKVKNDLISKLQDEKAKKDAETSIAAVKETGSIDQIAKKKNLEKKITKLFTRTESLPEIGNSNEFIKAGFALSAKNKIYPDVIKTNKGYFILAFKEKLLPEESSIQSNLEDTRSNLVWMKQNQAYQSWITAIKNQNKIEIDPGFLN